MEQPHIRSEQCIDDSENDETVEYILDQRLNISRSKLNSFKISVYLVAKQQNIILNIIPAKRTTVSAVQNDLTKQVNKQGMQMNKQMLGNPSAGLASQGQTTDLMQYSQTNMQKHDAKALIL